MLLPLPLLSMYFVLIELILTRTIKPEIAKSNINVIKYTCLLLIADKTNVKLKHFQNMYLIFHECC